MMKNGFYLLVHVKRSFYSEDTVFTQVSVRGSHLNLDSQKVALFRRTRSLNLSKRHQNNLNFLFNQTIKSILLTEE